MNTINSISKYLASGILLFTFYLGTVAQTTTLTNVEEAFAIAIKKNIDFKNYALIQEKAEYEYRQTKNHRLPTLSGNLNGQRNLELATTPLPGEIFGQPGQTIEAQFGQEYAYNAGLTLTSQLLNREANLHSKITKLNVRIASVDQEVFEELLMELVTLYYYTGLIAKRAIEIGEKDLESAEIIRLLAEEKYSEGILEAISVNTSRINEYTVMQNVNGSKQLEFQCLLELKKLLGLSPSDTLILAEKFEYELPELIEIDQLEKSSEIKIAGIQLDQAELQLKQSKAALWPLLTFNTYLGKQQFRDDFGMDIGNNSWTNYSYLSLNLSIPIYTGFNTTNRIKKNVVDQRIAQNVKEETVLNTSINDQLLLNDYYYCLRDAEAALEKYRLYEDNQKLTFQKYNEGLISLDGYLSVFEDYIRAENNYLNTMSKVYTHYSKIIPRIK